MKLTLLLGGILIISFFYIYSQNSKIETLNTTINTLEKTSKENDKVFKEMKQIQNDLHNSFKEQKDYENNLSNTIIIEKEIIRNSNENNITKLFNLTIDRLFSENNSSN